MSLAAAGKRADKYGGGVLPISATAEGVPIVPSLDAPSNLVKELIAPDQTAVITEAEA